MPHKLATIWHNSGCDEMITPVGDWVACRDVARGVQSKRPASVFILPLRVELRRDKSRHYHSALPRRGIPMRFALGMEAGGIEPPSA